MVIYESRIGKPVHNHTNYNTPNFDHVCINDLEELQRQALWRAIKKTKPRLADLMTKSKVIDEVQLKFKASFMMKHTEVEKLLTTEGVNYEWI